MRRLLPILAAGLLAACAYTPPNKGWISPATLKPVEDPLAEAASKPVVLLGEFHDNAEDHRWQLATIQMLFVDNPKLVLAFEMFPRADQPVLDQWVAGGLSEDAFLSKADWKHVWGFPKDLYLPIFRFARDHHIPMLALNVSGKLVHLTGTKGFAAVPPSDREGVRDPAPIEAAYRDYLADIMSNHSGLRTTPDTQRHFIEAQTLWDSAMAQAIADQHDRAPGRQIVAIMGTGHLQHRWGVPHQLAALGLANSAVFLPYHEDLSNPDPPPGSDYADALYED
jgi:uncharacterized iron-regulated protein